MNGFAHLKISGDVRVVLEGRVDPEHTPTLSLSEFPFALGAGRVSRKDFFGETLVFFHQAYVTFLTEAGEIHTEKKENALVSPFLLGLKIHSFPDELFYVENQKFKSVQNIFEKRVKLGCFYVAHCLFDPFEGAFIKKSPIYGENINENPKKYWEKEPALKNQTAYLFGVLVTDLGKKEVKKMEYAFYENPNEREKSGLLSHTHALITQNQTLSKTWEELKTNFFNCKTQGVRHFLTDSYLRQGAFALFELIQ